MSEKPTRSVRAVPRTEEPPPDPSAGDGTTYTLLEHQVAAAQGAYGRTTRPEHVSAAWTACHRGEPALTRAQMQEALEQIRRMPAGGDRTPVVTPHAQRRGRPAAQERSGGDAPPPATDTPKEG